MWAGLPFFSTHVSDPKRYRPSGASVRVILMVNDRDWPGGTTRRAGLTTTLIPGGFWTTAL